MNKKEERLKKALGPTVETGKLLKDQPQEFPMSEGEKTQGAILMNEVNQRRVAADQATQAFSEWITMIVRTRGLDPAKWGVNFGLGKILPMLKEEKPEETPPAPPPTD